MADDKGQAQVAEVAGILGRDGHYAEAMKQPPALNVKWLKSDPSVWFDGEQDFVVVKYVDGLLLPVQQTRWRFSPRRSSSSQAWRSIN